jgi:uncharacterized membrane protein YhaH (DUF805 family)
MMTFGDAIKTCFTKYAEFNGRASRSEYWWYVLFIILVSVAISRVSPTISGLFSLATFLPSIAAAARRLHDTDKSGWLQLLIFIPVLGWLILIYLLVQESKEPNRFSASST